MPLGSGEGEGHKIWAVQLKGSIRSDQITNNEGETKDDKEKLGQNIGKLGT